MRRRSASLMLDPAARGHRAGSADDAGAPPAPHRRTPGIQDIVQGPDGNMWFTERNANMIGRISGSSPGRHDRVPAGRRGNVAGPHRRGARRRALVHAGQQHRRACRRATRPASTRFTGLGIVEPRGIAVGPDGNLWVADADAATARSTASRRPARRSGLPIPLPPGVNARGIARGARRQHVGRQLQHPRLGRPRHHGRHAGAPRPLPGPGRLADRRDRRQRRERLVRRARAPPSARSRRTEPPPRSRARASTRSASRSGPTAPSGSPSSRRTPSAAWTRPASPATSPA